MTILRKQFALVFLLNGFFLISRASNLDTIGVTLLRETTTNLDGSNIQVGQAEAGDGAAAKWQVNPGVEGMATNLFTYYYSSTYVTVSTANTYPNALGSESGHAEFVADKFYGVFNGVATNVSHVDNYEANTFVYYYVGDVFNIPHSIPDRIVNHSYTFGTNDTAADQAFDDYIAQNNVLFLFGVAGPPVFTPASCYNGIAVGSFWSPAGPTSDGRCKPDIIAPGFAETSYTTPQVSGAATVLLQAGLRGDGGSDTNSATDARTLKALLLNGAVKPANWTNSTSSPLDARYGAGVLNVFNSYQQLAGGRHGSIVSTTVSVGGAHPPTGAPGTVPVLNGWDLTNCVSLAHPANDAVNHYYFNVTNSTPDAFFTATATLVWNRQQNQTSINDLNLFLYNCANSNLVACSTSLVDNVEHIFVPKLPQGRYDLQVWKAGGNSILTTSETYALAWEFVSPSLAISNSGAGVTISWPIYPAGYALESATDLVSQNWKTNGLPLPVMTNGQNVVSVSATNADLFFRLRMPNF
ncbi:MAG TPA: S8 family serine peptidase [Verrucomicrobiae bacterium]|nr:S8 family serine peptidase [Verrucomicrobiae bacterium]